MAKKRRSNVLGVVSLVSGILGLSFFFMSTWGLILSILAIFFYNIQIKKFPNKIATAGLILGLIGLVINMILFIWALLSYLGIYMPI
jgi:membrane-bound ClpP family serine protease